MIIRELARLDITNLPQFLLMSLDFFLSHLVTFHVLLAGDHSIGGKGESAGEYFDSIMKETGATVLWPSKLKIGAKSKKHPHVKVIGFPDAVEKARELICKDLDTKVYIVIMSVECV